VLPGVHGGLGPVAGPVHLHEGVSGAVVGVELIGLACRLERGFEFGDVLGRGMLILSAEQPEERAGQVRGPLDQGRGAVQRVPLGRGLDDEAAVAVDGRLKRQADRGEERLPAARAVADHADLAVGVGQPAQVRRRARHLADDPLVGDGDRAGRPRRRHRVVRGGPRRLAVVQVRHHRVQAADGERPGELLGLPVVAGQVMQDHDPAHRAGLERPGRVGLDLVAAVPGDGYALGQYRVVHRPSPRLVVDHSERLST
jgi:hypothetical protein